MKTYKNSTVDSLVKSGLCIACGKQILTEQDKKNGSIRCKICREDLKRGNGDRRQDRKSKDCCPTCGKPKIARSDNDLPVSPYCHDCAFGKPEIDYNTDNMDKWIEWNVPLVKKHRRLFMRLHDPERKKK